MTYDQQRAEAPEQLDQPTTVTQIEQSTASDVRTETSSRRRELAKLFETFLIGRMQQGAVEADDAKEIAQRFVTIFQTADSAEAHEEAIRKLEKEHNTILHNFGLKILESEEVQAKSELYQYMIKLANEGQINAARSLYQLFDQNLVHNEATLHQLITEQKAQLTLKAQAQSIIDALTAQGLTESAKQLTEQIEHGQITSMDQLTPWSAQVTSRPETIKRGVVKSATKANLQDLNQVQRIWLGIHALDQRLRALLQLKK